MPQLTAREFASIYERFSAPVTRFDCGRKCAPLNKGEPVCCSTQHAVPVVDVPEFKLLQSRSDLWRRFKPYDAATRKIVDDLPKGCAAVECKGVRHCERDNRSLACRAFPFFPYMTKEKVFVGLAVYWVFNDRCWLMSNLGLVDKAFVDEFVEVFDEILAKDKGEFDTFVAESASSRRVHSRLGLPLVIIARSGELMRVDPTTGAIRPHRGKAAPKYGPFRSERAYGAAVREAGGEVPKRGLRPE